nr:sodium/calcium exchanger membrane region, calcium binding protein 2 [Tanacetum cinerariifolium]
MELLDADANGSIEKDEFMSRATRWLKVAAQYVKCSKLESDSVRIFSENVKIAPCYVSFILVSLATNARTTIAAIRASQHKKHHTTSLTFSQ